MLAVGTRLGPYEIQSELGVGGMGAVYKALDRRLDRTVAIKLVPESGDGSPSVAQRIDHEARAISRLKHPHICTLYDIGEADAPAGHTVRFLVLELIEGETLADRVARGALPPHEALTFAVQIADALQAAHRGGVVHGDLKPGNVMISRTGVKLLDFGLARQTRPAVTGSLDAVTAPVSPGGNATVLGTLQYLAPEQLEGREPDARSDIFSCGAVIYEMVTGRKAFAGDTPAAVVAAIMHRTPPPVVTSSPVPSALDHVLSACLAKSPEDRWQDAGDLMRELSWIAAGGSAGVVPAKQTRTRRGLAALAAALVAAAAIVAAALYMRPGTTAALPYRTSILLPEGLRFPLPGTFGGVGRFAVSPDGRRLAFVATDPAGEQRLWLRPLDSLMAQPLAGTEGAFSPFWSPDSLRIAFVASGQLKTIDPAGGSPTIVAASAFNTTGAWGRDNTILYTPSAASPLHRVPASGGPSVEVTTLNREDGEVLHRNPVLLDGSHVLFTSVGPREGGVTGARAIHVRRLDASGPPRVLIASPTTARYAQGQVIFLRDNALLAQPLDLASLTLTGEPRVIADQVELMGPASAAFSVSDTGVLAYQPASGGSQLVWVDRDGREVDTVSDPAEYGELELSPDGERSAVSVLDPDRNTRDLWVVDLMRGVRTRLTTDAADDVAPVWSPDGAEIVFASNRGGHFDLYRKSASGIGEDQLLFRDNAEKYPTSWSADRSTVLYWQFDADGTSLRTLALSGAGQPEVFLDGPVSQGRLSPDGRWVVYDSTQSGRSEVYVVSFPDASRRWRVSTDGGRLSRWRADGREILYAARDNRVMAAAVSSTPAGLTIGSVQPLFEARPVGIRAFFAPSADGSRFLLNTLRAGTPSVSIAVLQNWMNATATR